MNRLALVVTAVVAIACGPSAKPASTMSVPAPTSDDPSCPLLVPGTSIAVEDAPDGASLVFVTTGDVTEVRKRAAVLAQMHDAHGTGDQMGAMISSPAVATAHDIEGGSRIAFTTQAPDEIAKIQSELRMHAHHLASGSCQMAM